jgi:hypothetical protein
MIEVYFDPNFLFNELLDYYAPVIIRIEDKMFIDLHSLSIVNLLGVQPVQKRPMEMYGLLLMSHKFPKDDIPETIELLEFNDSNLDKFKISNLIALKDLYYNNLSSKKLLRLENTLNDCEIVLSLCNQYVIQKKELFHDRKLEILLEIIAIAEIRKLSEERAISFSMKQPFIFSFDLSNIKFEIAYEFIQDLDRLNDKLTSRVPKIYEYAVDKIKMLDKLLSSIDRKSLTNVSFVFESIDELIFELTYFKNLIDEIESLDE